MDSKLLIGMLEANTNVIQRQIAGLSHEDSLLQPPPRGNCLNWMLGHIVNGRDQMLILVDEDPNWTDEERARYQTNANPITQSTQALPFDKIIDDLNASHARLQIVLASLTEVNLAQPLDGDTTLGTRLHGLLWHETYHVGQTEYLRQLSGVNDKVI